MNGYIFIRSLMASVLLGFLFLGVFTCFAVYTVGGITSEISYRHRYGAEWQVEFEKKFGPVSEARMRTAATGFGTIALPSLVYWLYRSLRPSRGRNKPQPRKRRLSHLEQTIQARRNALLYNYGGLGGIAIGVLLVIFRWHLFARHTNEVILGMFVFCAGYCCVITGCWWWLKAKAWPEAVIFIGVMPLGVLFVPFVRLVFVANPFLLAAAMAMMSAILLVVVLVLPDKSGVNKRRAPMNLNEINRER